MLRKVRFDCASMKAEELSNSSDSGRQDRKGTALVMLLKKLKHDMLEKFCVRLASKGCKNGIGRVGGVDGTVGTGALAVDVGEVLGEETTGEDEIDDASCRGSKSRWRLCGVQLRACEANLSHDPASGASAKMSKATGCIRYCVEAVMRMRTRGTSITVHLVLRPIRRFSSTGGNFLVVPASSTGVRGLSSLIVGRGDGGGVNMGGGTLKRVGCRKECEGERACVRGIKEVQFKNTALISPDHRDE